MSYLKNWSSYRFRVIETACLIKNKFGLCVFIYIATPYKNFWLCLDIELLRTRGISCILIKSSITIVEFFMLSDYHKQFFTTSKYFTRISVTMSSKRWKNWRWLIGNWNIRTGKNIVVWCLENTVYNFPIMTCLEIC